MALPRGRVSTRLFLALGFLGLAVGGCGEPVREDRTITWSAEGNAVGFQHGDQGVFVADTQGGGLKKVFQPEADVIATSTPLWAPGGRRLIFTTARSASGEPPAPGLAVLRGAEPNPAGELFSHFPIVYTCWLRDESVDEPPMKLFEARCDHAGYVAANLAVRWHPRGDRILYIDAVSGGNHALFAYDLQTKASRQVFPHNAQALIFDWTPNATHLACVLGQAGGSPDRAGVWIGEPDRNEWWHVPGSGNLAEAELPSLLERLRATRPAWTGDGARFAFVSSRPGKPEDSPGPWLLNVGNRAERSVAVEAEDAGRLQDLVWAPDGQRLGLVRSRSDAAPTLHVWSRAAGLSGPLDARPVRHFAGWCAGGDHLAYVVPDETPGAAGPLWSLLLIPDPLARDAVVIGDGAGQGSGRSVFSGMRVTFPHWSPADETLSVWCTFSPPFRSVLSRFLSSGLRPGDPAAVLDARTGSLSWMTVNPQEEEQVGHYLLLKRDYAEALGRYDRAGGAVDPPEPATATEWLAQFSSPRGLPVFQFHGLTKLGRHEEARARLAGFRKSYPPLIPREPAAENTSPAGFLLDQPWFREALVPGGLVSRLLQDLSVAEAFLSLDAGEDGRAFFRALVDSPAAGSDAARPSAAVVLSQFLLIDGRFDEYAALATETLGPLFLATRDHLPASPSPAPPRQALATLDLRQRVPEVVVGLALLPLMAPSFLAGLSDDRLMEMVPRWEALRAQAEDDVTRAGIDLVLNASYQQLGWETEHQETARRLRNNPEISGEEAAQGVTDAMLQSLRVLLTGTALGANGWGAPGVR